MCCKIIKVRYIAQYKYMQEDKLVSCVGNRRL
jgi:hypothetical protein